MSIKQGWEMLRLINKLNIYFILFSYFIIILFLIYSQVVCLFQGQLQNSLSKVQQHWSISLYPLKPFVVEMIFCFLFCTSLSLTLRRGGHSIAFFSRPSSSYSISSMKNRLLYFSTCSVFAVISGYKSQKNSCSLKFRNAW